MDLTIAVVQMNSNDDWKRNLNTIEKKCLSAQEKGAHFIAFPEYSFQVPILYNYYVETESNHPAIKVFSSLAKDLKIWIHSGSLAIQDLKGNIHNCSYVFDCNGVIVGKYNKINLFDANLGDKFFYNESDFFKPGEVISSVNSPWGKIGLTICYDIRFPLIYQNLANKNCKIIFIPSAFSYITGKAHWEILVRARAIETQCFIIAPAQCGVHNNHQRSYGRSMIVDPWGNVIAKASEKENITYGKIDLEKISQVKSKMPINNKLNSISTTI